MNSLFMVNERPWFADLANFKAAEIISKDQTWQQRKKFLHDARFYIWDDPHLFNIGVDNLLRRCVTREEAKNILWHCHNSPCGGHYGGDKTTAKVLQSGFFWPMIFKDAHQHVLHCDQCQRMGGHLQKKWNASTKYYGGWGLWLLGDWLCRSILLVIWKWILRL